MTVRPAHPRGDVACSPRGAVVPPESSQWSVFSVSRDPPPPRDRCRLAETWNQRLHKSFVPSCQDADRRRRDVRPAIDRGRALGAQSDVSKNSLTYLTSSACWLPKK